MIHLHIAFWIVGAPRIDKIEVPREKKEDEKTWVEIDVVPDGSVVVPEAAAADQLASFWDRAFTEFNVAKAMGGRVASEGSAWAGVSTMAPDVGVRQQLGTAEEKKVRSPESISYETLAHCLLGGLEMNAEEDARCWSELEEILHGCARGSAADMNELLVEPSSASSEAKRANARLHFVAALAEWVNMHDLHRPYAMGPPGKEQRCAHVEDEHSSMEAVTCNKLFPRKVIEAGMEEVAEDPRRRDLYRLWMARNCNFLNNFVPLITMAMLSNMDFQATLSKDAVIEYMTKYATKSGQGSLIKVGRMRERISKAYVLAGGENVAPVSDSALDKEDPAGTSETQPNIQEWSLRTSKNY